MSDPEDFLGHFYIELDSKEDSREEDSEQDSSLVSDLLGFKVSSCELAPTRPVPNDSMARQRDHSSGEHATRLDPEEL